MTIEIKGKDEKIKKLQKELKTRLSRNDLILKVIPEKEVKVKKVNTNKKIKF